ncbi:hypothetical protein [Croceicoccus gelatinilyticus]|uniref:hypothetical protein n=1 Tax=Croceicoccus gelatinilyticus TaxID=2835536 RepID=UPI001BD03BA7|nr:hypothetical protein [Croceicoccus gelatinilyticus]MBS7671354.1 hypothetical protein [Croceicoccus gelatinilyticus]
MIEKFTGQSIEAMISSKARNIRHAGARNSVLTLVSSRSGDDLIQEVSRQLDTSGLTWSDLFSARSDAIGFDQIFSEMMGGAGSIFSGSNARAPSPPRKRRVMRSGLPLSATVIPTLQRTGTARTGQQYAVFYLEGDLFGEDVKFVGDFVAFGDAWVSELLSCEASERPVLVEFLDDGNPGKMVKIRKPRL